MIYSADLEPEPEPGDMTLRCLDYQGREGGDVEMGVGGTLSHEVFKGAKMIRLSVRDEDGTSGTRAIVYLTADEGKQVLQKLAEILGYIKRNPDLV